jgi:PDZ domain-containing secreted protein
MSKLTEEQMVKGRKRFLESPENAAAARAVASLTQHESDILGVTLEERQRIATMQHIREKAAAIGVDSTELFFSLCSDTAEEFDALKKTRDESIQRALGVTW